MRIILELAGSVLLICLDLYVVFLWFVCLRSVSCVSIVVSVYGLSIFDGTFCLPLVYLIISKD